jgi:glycosyltransferase involved in cell wall biosynthesis/GT2 family glycosyltransferase
MTPNQVRSCLVNLAELHPPTNGGQSRVAHLVSGLLAKAFLEGRLDVHFVVNWKFAGEFESWLGLANLQVIPFHSEGALTAPLFAQIHPDLIISPLLGTWPFGASGPYQGIPHLAAMPDALALDHPELFSGDELIRRRRSYDTLKSAALVVTFSEHSRSRLQEYLGLAPEKVRVIPLAGDALGSGLAPLPTQIRTPYIFFPANGWPHKRHGLLLRAMKIIRQPRPDLQLVLAGWHPRGYIDALGAEAGLPRAALIDLGYLPDDRPIAALYEHAEALIFPSSYEGFGMPVLEAMHHGCPVICARLTSLPEVAGDAALYVDSDDPGQWARAFLEQLPAQRNALIARGREQAHKFSLDRTRGLWRDLLGEMGLELSGPPAAGTPRPHAYRAALKELLAWSEHYAASQHELETKEEHVRALVEGLQTSPRVWLAHSPLARFWLYRLAAQIAKLPLNLLFPAVIFELEQHAPRQLRVSSRRPPPALPAPPPSIGIVTPSLNQGAFLDQTIHSVINQDYPRLEYVIQDGGSTDGSLEILRARESQLTHWESRHDEGQAHALNLGFKRVDTDLMAYLNSDDLLLPGALHFVAEYFARNPKVDVLYSHRIIVNRNGDEVGRWILAPHDPGILPWGDYVPQETLFWRRSIWERCGAAFDTSYRFALDWDLLLRFQNAGAVIRRVPAFLALFRAHGLQKTRAEMSTTGMEEMDRIREKYLGRRVTSEEIARHVRGFQRRSLLYRQAWMLGWLRI